MNEVVEDLKIEKESMSAAAEQRMAEISELKSSIMAFTKEQQDSNEACSRLATQIVILKNELEQKEDQIKNATNSLKDIQDKLTVYTEKYKDIDKISAEFETLKKILRN